MVRVAVGVGERVGVGVKVLVPGIGVLVLVGELVKVAVGPVTQAGNCTEVVP